jgi:KTSC domain
VPLIIEVQPVKSSNLKAIGYDSASSTLAVEFANGTYHYAEVDAALFAQLEASDSKGTFFQQFIRKQFIGVKQLPISIEAVAKP